MILRRRLAPLALLLLCGLAAGAGAGSLRERVAWQVALERVGLSPGIIDGIRGPKTELATWEFQRVRGLPKTGRLDARTAEALGVDPDAAVTTYTVTAADAQAVGPCPTDWLARSRLDRMAYPSLAAAVAERFHCSRGLLGRLNPALDIERLAVGDRLRAPAVPETLSAPRGARVDVNLAEKVIRVIDAERRLVGLFHCSIPADRTQLPKGETTVAVIVENPNYTFDPAMWPEVEGIDRKL
ncbi:MAG: peptidoglycan-binding domain-containing protein, partial [Planctomycetota bacterium]